MTLKLPQVLEEHVLQDMKYYQFVSQKVQLPDGKIIEKGFLNHPGAVAIVPLVENGDVILINQYRTPIGGMLLEIPAGTLEHGEDPRHCAERELQEEIGYFPGTLTQLGEFFVAPGVSNEKMYLFVASNLRPSQLEGDIDEVIELRQMPLEDARALIATGEIHDAKTIIGLLRVKPENQDR
jgi:ADP-ribose pyrophosphatase